MDTSVLSLREIQWIWMFYYGSAFGFWLLCAYACNFKRFQWVSIISLAALAGIVFTPWYIVENKSDMAPAFIILLFDRFAHTGQSLESVLIPILFVTLIMLVVLAGVAGIVHMKNSTASSSRR